MPFAARQGDEVGSSSHTIIGPCSLDVMINEKPASIDGDTVQSPTHKMEPTIVTNVKINNKKVCVLGDMDKSGHAITKASTNVKFGI